MGVKVEGLNQLLDDLEKRLGKEQLQRISDTGLKNASDVFVRELKSQLRTFSNKQGYSEGYTYDEVQVSEPKWEGSERVIKVYWQGPHSRYRIIHLNEWGTVKNPNPAGKGRIAAALKNSEKAYHEAIRRALKEGI